MTLLLLFNQGTGPDTGPGVLRQYSVGNRGTADLVVGTLELEEGTGDVAAFTIEADNASGATIPVGESRTFKVRFDPSVEGTYLAAVRIPSSDPDGALTIALLGEAIEEEDLVPGITVDPLTWDFGEIDTATGSAATVVTVSSTGTAPLVCGTAVLGGAGAASYALSANGVTGATIPAGESRTVTVTLDPASDGTKAGTLTIPSDAGASIVVTLTGVGTTGEPAPEPTLVTRFYLGRQGAPLLDIVDPPTGQWNGSDATEPDYLLAVAKGGPVVSVGPATAHTGTSGHKVRLARWVSDPLSVQTYSGPFLCYAIGHRSTALGANVTSALRFGIWRDVSDTVDWQPILSMGSVASAWPDSSGPLPRRFPHGTPYSWTVDLDIEEGDRLIVELGFRAFSTSTNQVRIRYGGASTGTDLANTQTEQPVNYVPWIEFSDGLLVAP